MRGIARDMNIKLQVITGINNILKKPDLTGKMTDIFLDMGDSENPNRRRFAVPAEAYKLVIDTKTNASVAFITSFDKDLNKTGMIRLANSCGVVCNELGYYFEPNPSAGYTVCCTYEEFRKHIRMTLPIDQVKNTLLTNMNKSTGNARSGSISPRKRSGSSERAKRRSVSPPKRSSSMGKPRTSRSSTPTRRQTPVKRCLCLRFV